MKHAVLGAGGLGGLLGGALARTGQPVTLVVRPEAAAAHPRRLSIESSVLGDFTADIEVAGRLESPPDILWVTVKATQLESALDSAETGVLGAGVVVPLLNGIEHMDLLRSRYGAEQVLAAVIRVESERAAPGRIIQRSSFAGLELAPRPSLQALAEELAGEVGATGLSCRVAGDETTMLWRKLVLLAPLALTTTALQAPVGQVRSDPLWRERLLACINEAVQVGRAEGAEVEVEPMLAAALGVGDDFRTSMQKDRAAGRPLELDAIAGPIVRQGRAHGIEVPVTTQLMGWLAGSP